MKYKKTSLEAREIFGIGRDDMRRLESDGVLQPKKNGQGIASEYGVDDLSRLLDVKMLLMGGFRISDMQQIFSDDYNSDERIDEQIRIYKKRIQILVFIKCIREDFQRLYCLSAKQVNDITEKATKKNNMPDFGTEKYWDIMWSFIKLIFIMEFLSQKRSFNDDDKKDVLKKIWDAYGIIESSWIYYGVELDKSEIAKAVLEIYDEEISEDTIRKFAKEAINDYLKDAVAVKEYINKEVVGDLIVDLDDETKICFGSMLTHFFEFMLEYFMDEESLFCIISNLLKFVRNLDKEALLMGYVRRK